MNDRIPISGNSEENMETMSARLMSVQKTGEDIGGKVRLLYNVLYGGLDDRNVDRVPDSTNFSDTLNGYADYMRATQELLTELLTRLGVI